MRQADAADRVLAAAAARLPLAEGWPGADEVSEWTRQLCQAEVDQFVDAVGSGYHAVARALEQRP